MDPENRSLNFDDVNDHPSTSTSHCSHEWMRRGSEVFSIAVAYTTLETLWEYSVARFETERYLGSIAAQYELRSSLSIRYLLTSAVCEWRSKRAIACLT
jgi:hypothetical protein